LLELFIKHHQTCTDVFHVRRWSGVHAVLHFIIPAEIHLDKPAREDESLDELLQSLDHPLQRGNAMSS
jgi:hypothetical protein